MITVTIEKNYGAATIKARVSAPTIERAVAIAGPNARIEFPIDGERFFAATTDEGLDYDAMDAHNLELAVDAELPGAYEAWMWRLMDVLTVEDDPAPDDRPSEESPSSGEARAPMPGPSWCSRCEERIEEDDAAYPEPAHHPKLGLICASCDYEIHDTPPLKLTRALYEATDQRTCFEVLCNEEATIRVGPVCFCPAHLEDGGALVERTLADWALTRT